jgi:hypothetical protein
MYDIDSCASGGSLTAALGGSVAHGANVSDAGWTFSVPADTEIAGARLWRAGEARSSVAFATTVYWLAAPNDIYDAADIFDKCNRYEEGCTGMGNSQIPMAKENLLDVPPGNLSGATHIYMNAACGGSNGYSCPAVGGGYSVAVSLYAADITLEQTAGPSASNVSGELATAPAVRGSSDVAFDASDPGSGVYEALFSVDGQVVQSTVLDSNGGHCQDVDGTNDGLPAFLYTQPCAPSVSVDVPFETTGLSNGVHHLVVSVIDAAGNAAPVLDREITINNPPPPGTPGPPNGTNASAQATLNASWVSSKKTRVASAYGYAHTIAGRLTAPGGLPIAGAQIDCTTTPADEGAKPVTMACPDTAPDGRFEVQIHGNMSSRTIELAYREHLGDGLPVTTRTLGLTVKAGVRLRVSPHTTAVGRSIHFTGKLLGGLIPHDGKQLVLEARSPGGPWIEFDALKTNAKGRYHDSYTFKFPGPANYRFRALSESEADYPFATGASNVVRVFER